MSKHKSKQGTVKADADTAGAGSKLSRKEYEQQLHDLHVELVKLQQWVVATGAKVVVVFEGRDGAGKGGR